MDVSENGSDLCKQTATTTQVFQQQEVVSTGRGALLMDEPAPVFPAETCTSTELQYVFLHLQLISEWKQQCRVWSYQP